VVVSSRLIAGLGLTGVTCDAIGGLYLAYDLFRRHAGPLGVLTRVVTYSVALGLPFWLALGPAFGAIAGIGFGVLVGFDFWWLARIQRLQLSSPLRQSAPAGAARGIVIGLAAMPRYGSRFGLAFAALAAAGLAALYRLGFVRTYKPSGVSRIIPHRAAIKAAFMRGIVIAAAAALAAAAIGAGRSREEAGLLIGLLVGVSSIAVAVVTPHVEWWTENAPDSFFIGAGLLLVFCGLLLDSVPYVVTLLRIDVR